MLSKPLDGHSFQDIAARKKVEIIIRDDELVVWVNVDGVCRTRLIMNGFTPIIIDDRREKQHNFVSDTI